MQIESRTCQACLSNYAEMPLCLCKANAKLHQLFHIAKQNIIFYIDKLLKWKIIKVTPTKTERTRLTTSSLHYGCRDDNTSSMVIFFASFLSSCLLQPTLFCVSEPGPLLLYSR